MLMKNMMYGPTSICDGNIRAKSVTVAGNTYDPEPDDMVCIAVLNPIVRGSDHEIHLQDSMSSGDA